MAKFDFIYKGKKFELDVKECKSIISQANGLMFKKNSKPLLFIFKKPTRISIHSFFCVPFIAIWINHENVIEVKEIFPWIMSIKPNKKFDKLLEIPFNDRLYKVFSRRNRNL